jgi:hypothetical protein
VSVILEPLAASWSEASDDKEVVEGDWRGLSMGETEAELATDDSVGRLRFSAIGFFGTAVEDIFVCYIHAMHAGKRINCED